MITTRRLATTLVAACLATGLTTVPVASAADGGTKATTAQKKKAKGPTTRKLNSDLRKVRSRTTKTERSVRSLDRTLKALDALAKGTDGKANTLLAAAPQLISGLTQLGDAVTKQIAPGLKQLSDAVQNQIAPNLTKLGDAYQSVEYGRAGLFATGATVAAGGSLTSADIPDDGNTITATETAIVVGGAPGAVTLDLRAAIRSAEEDGDAANETAGQAGGFLFVKNADTGARVACTGAPNPPGILGTVAGDTIQTPSGPVTNLPLKNIAGGVLRTDQTQPTASTGTSLLPAVCGFANGAPGTVYEVHYSVNFADIPTSTTPGAKE